MEPNILYMKQDNKIIVFEIKEIISDMYESSREVIRYHATFIYKINLELYDSLGQFQTIINESSENKSYLAYKPNEEYFEDSYYLYKKDNVFQTIGPKESDIEVELYKFEFEDKIYYKIIDVINYILMKMFLSIIIE